MPNHTVQQTVTDFFWSPAPGETYYTCRGVAWWRVNPITQQAELHCSSIDKVEVQQAIGSSLWGVPLPPLTLDSFMLIYPYILLLVACVSAFRLLYKQLR